MSTLVIAEHDNQENKAQTLVAIAAAEAIGNEIHVLVAGSGAEGVATQVRKGGERRLKYGWVTEKKTKKATVRLAKGQVIELF